MNNITIKNNNHTHSNVQDKKANDSVSKRDQDDFDSAMDAKDGSEREKMPLTKGYAAKNFSNLDDLETSKSLFDVDMEKLLAAQQSKYTTDGMQGQMHDAQLQQTDEVVNVSNEQDFEVVATKLVERILVSQPDAIEQKVQIKVSNDILNKTEINISRDQQGNLHVSLVTDDPKSWQTLVHGQNNLRALLAKNEENVVVTVKSSAENDAGNNDSNRRSSTFMQAEENKG